MGAPQFDPESAAESAIGKAEERFREVFERSPVGVARVGLDGTWLELNDRFCDMLGYTKEELEQIRPWDLVHPEDANQNLDERNRLISGEARFISAEARYLRKDGKTIWIARTAALVCDPSGTPQYFVAVGQDVTDRRQEDDKLQQAMKLSSGALAASRIGFFRWDLKSGQWDWDQRVAGSDVKEVIRTLDGVLAQVVPEDRAELFKRLNRSVTEGVAFEDEFRATVPPDGAIAWIYARGKIVREQNGDAAYMTGALINMTEYRLLRRELENRQEVMLLAQSAGGVHPWAVDAVRSRRIWWTPGSYRLYGRQEQLGPPTREEFLKLVHPEDQARVRDQFQVLQKEEGEDSFTVEFRTAPASGRVLWVLSKGRVNRDPGGWPRRLVGVDIDITERRQAEESRRRLEKLSVLQRLAMSIAHEINNPLMALSNELYLITSSSTLEEAKKYARMAQEEIARITHYSGKLLPVDRKSPLRYPHKVSEILGAILNILEHRYPNVEATADFRDSTLLPASRADLEQLFGILLGNAFEAVATEGRVRIKVLERGPAHSKPGIYVVIGDTGKGMNAEVKAHLFEPFFSTKATTGLGLGLWMASGIVQQYGGRIRIRSSDSTTHHGTVVSVFLPFQSSSGSKFTSSSSSNA